MAWIGKPALERLPQIGILPTGIQPQQPIRRRLEYRTLCSVFVAHPALSLVAVSLALWDRPLRLPPFSVLFLAARRRYSTALSASSCLSCRLTSASAVCASR